MGRRVGWVGRDAGDAIKKKGERESGYIEGGEEGKKNEDAPLWAVLGILSPGLP